MHAGFCPPLVSFRGEIVLNAATLGCQIPAPELLDIFKDSNNVNVCGLVQPAFLKSLRIYYD